MYIPNALTILVFASLPWKDILCKIFQFNSAGGNSFSISSKFALWTKLFSNLTKVYLYFSDQIEMLTIEKMITDKNDYSSVPNNVTIIIYTMFNQS